MVRVKICGITSAADALTAQRAGADAVGFVFAKSPRRVTPSKARAIVKKMGERTAKVGVFVNASPAAVLRTAKYCGLDAVQLHGDESPAVVRALRAKGLVVIKAFRVKKTKDLEGTAIHGTRDIVGHRRWRHARRNRATVRLGDLKEVQIKNPCNRFAGV